MEDEPPILIVEDTPSLHLIYAAALRKAGHTVAVAETAADAARDFARLAPKVVLMDLRLPDGCGINLTADFLARTPETRVIVITSDGTIAKAVEAMRAGAQEFLVKPFDEQRLLSAVRNALRARCAPPAPAPKASRDAFAPPGAFIGRSPEMRTVYDRIRSVARSMATVFITGESGTGKELCAQAVHASSPRARGPFIALNCGAIPADLLESEVFGHLKGSFTGAIADKPGAAAAADGGTLFLDEICEMDLALQTKLLRFLQTSTIQPVGATHPRKVDVRIVCATNRDPLAAVRDGRFREDLYYRLHVVPIDLPPLRQRGDDVIEIARHALRDIAAEEGKPFTDLDAEVATLFRRHPWPGNVRQLINALRNVVVLHDGPLVRAEMLPGDIAAQATASASTATPAPANDAIPPCGAGTTGNAAEPGDDTALAALVGRPLAEIEQLVIEATIARCDGSVPRAARMLDVAPSTLYRKRDAWTRRMSRDTAAE